MRTVQVVPYDAAWPGGFERAAVGLRAALGGNLVALHHVGSTAVPGLAAKPIIDILPVVRDRRLVDEAALVRLGYRPRGERGLPGRLYFVRDVGGRRTHHVHVYEEGDPAVARHLAVRDHLRARPDEARRYAALKRALVRRHGGDRELYAEGKAPFVAEIQRRALARRADR